MIRITTRKGSISVIGIWNAAPRPAVVTSAASKRDMPVETVACLMASMPPRAP